MTGYSISEYIRNRKLYMAALELKKANRKVIDVAFDYGYDTPDSFTKAFTRFHGISPVQVKQGGDIRTFLPLSVKITVQGGDKMDYKITKMFGFKVIGFAKEFSFDTAYEEIPKYWDEICEKYAANVYAGNPPANPYEKAFVENCIGEYGICIDDGKAADKGKFTYLVAGKYAGGEVPEGMMLYEFEQGEWAVFDCVGAIPEALQSNAEQDITADLKAALTKVGITNSGSGTVKVKADTTVAVAETITFTLGGQSYNFTAYNNGYPTLEAASTTVGP